VNKETQAFLTKYFGFLSVLFYHYPFTLFNLPSALHNPGNGQHRLINTSLLPNCELGLRGGLSS